MKRAGVKYLERLSRTDFTEALLDYWICVQMPSSHFANIYQSDNFENISRNIFLE